MARSSWNSDGLAEKWLNGDVSIVVNNETLICWPSGCASGSACLLTLLTIQAYGAVYLRTFRPL